MLYVSHMLIWGYCIHTESRCGRCYVDDDDDVYVQLVVISVVVVLYDTESRCWDGAVGTLYTYFATSDVDDDDDDDDVVVV